VIPTYVADRLIGGALLVLGLVSILEGRRTWDGIGGTGFMPVLLGGAFALLGIGMLASRRAPAVVAWPSGSARRSLFTVSAMLLWYAVAVPWIGYTASTTAFLAGLVRFMGRLPWWKSLALGIGVALFTHVVFRVWLHMPLPDGLFGM
jgi:putative tricarboxylic transport membrane protein